MAVILLVDDDLIIRKMIGMRLKRRGHKIHTADNGFEGVIKAIELQPDLVLMDMHMPVMNGHDAVRMLRKRGYSGMIIAVTASAMPHEIDQASNSGCNQIISKPLTPEFEDQIQQVLNTIINS